VTLQDYLNRNIRRSTIFCWIAVPFGIIAVVTGAHGYIGVPALLIAGAFYVVALYHTYSARCPRCRTALLVAEATFGIHLAVPRWFKSCPSCGLSFDTPLDAPQRSNQSLEPTAGRTHEQVKRY
jgi:hypothetical protein